MSVKVETYKGIEITYSPSSRTFEAQFRPKEDAEIIDLEAKTQKELEEIIDKYLKHTKFPIEAIQLYHDRLVKITSFSVVSRSYGESLDVWISYHKTPDYQRASEVGREKTSLNNFFKPTEENLKLLSRIQIINEQVKVLQEESTNLKTKFTDSITRKDILGD